MEMAVKQRLFHIKKNNNFQKKKGNIASGSISCYRSPPPRPGYRYILTCHKYSSFRYRHSVVDIGIAAASPENDISVQVQIHPLLVELC
jgi:hypothetical protein